MVTDCTLYFLPKDLGSFISRWYLLSKNKYFANFSSHTGKKWYTISILCYVKKRKRTWKLFHVYKYSQPWSLSFSYDLSVHYSIYTLKASWLRTLILISLWWRRASCYVSSALGSCSSCYVSIPHCFTAWQSFYLFLVILSMWPCDLCPTGYDLTVLKVACSDFIGNLVHDQFSHLNKLGLSYSL